MGERGAMALEGDRLPSRAGIPACTPWTPPAQATCFAAASSTRSSTASRLMPTPRLYCDAAAAVSCTRLGALNGVPTLDEVNELVASGKVRV